MLLRHFTLEPRQTVLLIVDMQEKIFNVIDRGAEILNSICTIVQGFQILNLPILLSEQYPEKLGQTVQNLKMRLGNSYRPWIKSTFSCLDDKKFYNYMLTLPYLQWIITGIEAHVCVLQTAKSLLNANKQVTVLNDAISSRSIYDFSTSIAEMRDAGVRISSTETVLFELLKDSQHPQFKAILELIT